MKCQELLASLSLTSKVERGGLQEQQRHIYRILGKMQVEIDIDLTISRV